MTQLKSCGVVGLILTDGLGVEFFFQLVSVGFLHLKKNPYHWFTWEMRRNLDPLSLPWFPFGSISHDENLTPNICSIEHRSAHRKNNLQPKKEKEKGLGKGVNVNYGYISDKYINTAKVRCVAGVRVTCIRPCLEQNRLAL